MAFPFKTGGDFYNCEAQRMRLHNLGANPTETATGLMYFNTGASNLGKHAVVHDGTNFKALAFVDEIATNTAFTELDKRVQTIEKALGEDTADVIDTWEEIQNFLKDINANDANLKTMLDDKLSKSQGGTIDGNLDIGKNNANYTTQRYLRMWYGDGAKVYRGMLRVNAQNIQLSYYVPSSGLDYALTIGSNGLKYYDAGVERTLIHSGNIGDYNAGGLAHSNGTVGAVVNESGNVTIGAEDKAGTAFKMRVDGKTAISASYRSAYPALGSLSANSDFNVAYYDADGSQYGMYFSVNGQNGNSVIQTGRNDGNTTAYNLLLNPLGGNVLIGPTDDNGAKLQVAGQISLTNSIYWNDKDWYTIGTKSENSDIPPFGFYKFYSGHIFETANGEAMRINALGNVTIGDSDLAGTDAKLNVHNILSVSTESATPSAKLNIQQFSSSNAVNGIHLFVGSNNSSYANARPLVLQNSYGNVLIGKIEDNGAKLQVNGYGSMSFLYFPESDGKLTSYVGRGSSSSDIYLYSSAASIFYTNGKHAMKINESQNVLIGTTNDNGAKLQIKGDVYVDGNIIATKEVSAGGVGQEGESGDGGAEVIDKELAKGQSSYTIPNTIGRSAVAVSLYEWNANNGSWDMCLADISVKDATITVTFGSATSVNHKLVAVG